MKFKRFTRPQFLQGIGRVSLQQLFAQFASDLAARQVELPHTALSDEAYFDGLAQMVMNPEALPVGLIEALLAIEELANEGGQERLEMAVIQAGLPIQFHEEASHGDIAVQVFLQAPELLAKSYNGSRIGRLSAFEYFGVGRYHQHIAPAPMPPAPEALEVLTGDLDGWFQEHQRGLGTTRIDTHEIDGEFWFFVRHGDTFARTAKVEQRQLEILHFRPAKDDVVVYSPKRNDLRIHAGTKGERGAYRQRFGQHLFGYREYFSELMAYRLQALREDCAAVLDPRGLPGVSRIVLREVELRWGRFLRERLIRIGEDVYAAARKGGRDAIPPYGAVTRAGFDFYFAGQARPRRVEVCVPNKLKLGRGCDARVVHEWLSSRGLRGRAVEVRNVELENIED